MSDIVQRLRNWRTVHLARLHLLMEEAADEMERLSRTGSNDAKTGDDATECHDQGVKCPERDRLEELRAAADQADSEYREEIARLRLTDAEREAVKRAAVAYELLPTVGAKQVSATLCDLLARLSPPAT